MANVPPSPSFLNVRCLFRDGGGGSYFRKSIGFSPSTSAWRAGKTFFIPVCIRERGGKGSRKNPILPQQPTNPLPLGNCGIKREFFRSLSTFYLFRVRNSNAALNYHRIDRILSWKKRWLYHRVSDNSTGLPKVPYGTPRSVC